MIGVMLSYDKERQDWLEYDGVWWSIIVMQRFTGEETHTKSCT